MRPALLLFLPLLGNLLLPGTPSLRADQFDNDIAGLTAAPHRLTGSPEYRQAADYVKTRLDAIGMDRVVVQDFATPELVVKRCDLTFASTGKRLFLHPMRPDGIVPPVTPAGGITGSLVFAAAGTAEDFKSIDPDNKIVVMDYNSGDGWIRAFQRGAKAVIFVKQGALDSRNFHFTEANANFPRYYYAGPPADLRSGETATINCENVWKTVAARNIFGFLRGTSPVFDLEKEEYVLIAVPLNTYGEVPDLSPGARNAANCAALLKLAEYYKRNRPGRHLVFAFFDGEAHGHLGATAFYRIFEETVKTMSLDLRQKNVRNERDFLVRMNRQLADPNPLAKRSDVARMMITRLKIKGGTHAFETGTRLSAARIELAAIRDSAPARAAALEKEISGLVLEKDEWNSVRRGLTKNQIPPAVMPRLKILCAEVRQDADLRLKELDLEQRNLDADTQLKSLLGGRWESLHISLLFGDTTSRWGMIIGGDSDLSTGNAGYYGQIQTAFLKTWEASRSEAPNFEKASVDSSISMPRLLWGSTTLTHSGEIAERMGIYAVGLGTCGEALPREGTPDDLPTVLDRRAVRLQIDEAAGLLKNVLASQRLSLHRAIVANNYYTLPEFSTDYKVYGTLAMGKYQGSSVANRPMADATIMFTFNIERKYQNRPPPRFCAFDNFQVVRANANGAYAFGPVNIEKEKRWGFGIMQNERGEVEWVSTRDTFNKTDVRIEMCESRHGAAVLPPHVSKILPIDVAPYNAEGDYTFDWTMSHCNMLDRSVFWFVDKKVKRLKLFRSADMVVGGSGPMAILGLAGSGTGARTGNSRNFITGSGFDPADQVRSRDLIAESAADLWTMDESRIAILRQRGVMNKSVEELHGRAEDYGLLADNTGDQSLKKAYQMSDYLVESTVYSKVRGLFNDLVRAILILLGLAIPFAYCLERLLVASPHIYRQIAWFAFFFIATFVVLFFSHPAFAISNTPIIIFLGFAIVLLSGLVIIMILQRFETEIKSMQGMTTGLHSADVARSNTIMAAMKMGISTMRRRPLRTALTTITIVLLTFTILGFASFGVKTGVVKLFIQPVPRYTGAFVHKMNWSELSPDITDIVDGPWRDISRFCRRYWLAPERDTTLNKDYTPGLVISRGDGSRPVMLRGVLGLDGRELKERKDIADLLGRPGDAEFEKTVWMSRAVAELMNVRAGDTVMIGGIRMKAGAPIDAARSLTTEDLDKSSILPVDFVTMNLAVQTAGQQQKEAESMPRQQNWATLPSDSVIIVPSAAAVKLGASLRALAFYTSNLDDSTKLGEALARVLSLPVSATRKDGIYFHMLGPIAEASGVKSLLFPLILGGLVIFGTMLGSVADREKEIYTFSALGLAPPHVASLFFSEALVYSMIGGLGGYLLSQAVMKVLSVLADLGMVRIPEMNYSSTNAVVTLLIIMGTVLLSSIYPAIKASKSANPGVLSSWKLPPPRGDVFDIAFPFTVSEYDMTGIVSFLKEHLDSFQETGLGVFIARGTELTHKEGSLGLVSNLSLAPFDLGVTQSFELTSSASEVQGINEIRIRIVRKSGQPGDWQRLNKVLLGDLRQQFLIWRSIPSHVMETYRERTLVAMKSRQASGAGAV